MNRFEWTDAGSIEEAIALLREGAVIKAGGVDLMDLLKERLVEPTRLVNLRRVPGLDRIAEGPEGLVLGPTATLARIAADPAVRRGWPALAEAAESAATPQIRNMATVGGNLLQRPRCWYFRSEEFHCRKKGGTRCFAQEGDNRHHAIFGNASCAAVHASGMATALVALGAKLEIAGPSGPRVASLEAFFTPPEVNVTRENALGDREILTAIAVPRPPSTARSAYLKQKEKESFDWPIAEAAAVLDVREGRVASASLILGSAAPVPHRAREAERELVGRAPTEAVAAAIAKVALKGARPLAHNGYKLPVFEAIVKRAILRAAGGGSGR